MHRRQRPLRPGFLAAVSIFGAFGCAGVASAQSDPSFEVYGFVQLDLIQDFNRVDPDWEAALRPSKIPTVDGQFGDDGQSIFSVRQSRLGVKGSMPVAGKDLEARFEFDLFGTGEDAGQTTFRLRHAYGRWGPLLAGQTNSVFMDGDTFPTTVEYWGPNGMVFVRTPQVRFTWLTGPHEIAVALEKPGNDIDVGNIRIIDPNLSIRGNEKLPDLTAHYKLTGGWGHVQVAGILRQVGFETDGTVDNEPKDEKLGWGINVSSNIKFWKRDVIHLSAVYGEGIASYMNDGGTDLAPVAVIGPAPPIFPPLPGTLLPDTIPMFGAMIYVDHYWNDAFSSSIGWSMNRVDNTNFQEQSAYHTGHYASANLLWTPDPRILMGGEVLWGQREDRNGAKGDDWRVQFSFKYSFSSKDFFK